MPAAAVSARVSSSREACCSRSNAACATQQGTAAAARAAGWQQRRRASRTLTASQRQCLASSSSSSSSRSRSSRRTLVARAAAEAPEQAGALVPDRPGYRTFQLEGCEFLVAETADGKLDLQDVYVSTDSSSSSSSSEQGPSYRRPDGLEAVTSGPRQYQAVPWYTEYEGDAIGGKPAKQWVWRYYLVPVATPEPLTQMDFDAPLYMLDAKTASVQLCEVHRLAPPGTLPQELRLRIREDAVTIDTAESIPDWEHVVQTRMQGAPSLSLLEQARLEQYLQALEAAREMGTIDEAEFEEAYDVHWLAGMMAGGAGVQALGASWEAPKEVVRRLEGEFASDDEDVMGGWDKELLEDFMQFDDESDEGDFEEFDSPAADY